MDLNSESSITKNAHTFMQKREQELTVKGAAEDFHWGISAHNHTQSPFFEPHHANCIGFSSKSTRQKKKKPNLLMGTKYQQEKAYLCKFYSLFFIMIKFLLKKPD